MGKISLRWVEGKMMTVTGSNGHSVVTGPSPDPEYQWVGVKPAEMLLMSAASCSAYDVVEILGKQREPLQDLKVICEGDQDSEPPYRFTRIHLHYIAKGDINPDRLGKAIQLSEDKYCSVLATLRPGVPLSSSFEVLKD
ncbi:MAG TPA: OsmC family protein [Anaerolineales bacterium]|nr:OsmC family protein [Anaerolineales bacterium]